MKKAVTFSTLQFFFHLLQFTNPCKNLLLWNRSAIIFHNIGRAIKTITIQNNMATKIRIINYSCDTVVVNFPLLYIHGQIDSKSGSVTCVNETINKQEEWPVICGMFKVLCFLEEGCNKIRLNSDSIGNACKTFSATYKKLTRKR